MWRKNNLQFDAGQSANDVFNFRGVTVATDIVGRHALVAFGKMCHQLWRTPGPTNPALRIDNNIFRLEKTTFNQWCQRQDGRGGIAAWISNQR